MKRIFALTFVAAAATAASAQSSITLYGVVDASVRQIRGDGNSHVNQMASGGNASSRLGFRGVEDLGGGMSASFWLEALLNNDHGSFGETNTNNQPPAPPATGSGMTFRQRSTVSLSGGFGELRLGRDLTASFRNIVASDVFGNVGVGSSLLMLGAIGASNSIPTQTRASNSIAYFLPPNLGGFHGQLNYALGENASNSANPDDGRYAGIRVGYAAGPLDVAASSGSTRYRVLGNYVQNNIIASYKFSAAKLSTGVFQERLRNAAGARANAWHVGVSVPVGVGEIKGSYTSVNQNAGAGDNDGKQLSLGYVHNLSKRTAVYTTYSRIDNKNGRLYHNGRATTVNGGNTAGFDLGLRHVF